MIHCLLIAYYFPPHVTPHALRWYYLCRELAELGISLDVVTTRMPARFIANRLPLPPSVHVRPTFPGPFFGLTYQLSREIIAAGTEQPAAAASPLWTRLQACHSLALRALNAFSVPDANAEWFPFAVAEARRAAAARRPDIVISTSEPRIGHLVGLCLKRSLATPWIVDYGDPWLYPVPLVKEPRWKRRLVRLIEHSVLHSADAVCLTTRGTRQLYLQRYPFIAGKTTVVEQGCDPERIEGTEPLRSDGFRIVYCGSWYKDLRNPQPFLDAITEFHPAQMEVWVAGRINEFSRALSQPPLAGHVRYFGVVSHATALAMEKGATLLLHIGNADPRQVPGKIYEYLATGRPLLVLAESEQDPACRLIAGMPLALAVKNEKREIIQALGHFHRLWLGGELDRTGDSRRAAVFSWKERARKMARTITACLERHHRHIPP